VYLSGEVDLTTHDRFAAVLDEGKPIIERHIATLESLCQKLDSGGRSGDSGRRDADRGGGTTKPDAPDHH